MINYLFRKRRTVIASPSIESQSEIKEDKVFEKESLITFNGGNLGNSSKFPTDIDLPAIRILCKSSQCVGELRHAEQITTTFEKVVARINLGERIMRDYINTCASKQEFTGEYFLLGNRQCRYCT